MPDYLLFPDLSEEMPDIPPESIISRTLFQDEQMRAILFGFAPGQELSEHTSAKTAVLHFLQGQARLTLGNEKMQVQAGTWVRMPPHLPHSILAETPLILILLMFG